MNVLILEDCETTATMLEGFVSACGHRPIRAPAEWVTTSPATEWPVDLVLLDIVLPGADGYELAAWMREQGLRAPIVAVTGTEDDPVKRQQYGIVGYVGKPVSLRDIKALFEQSPIAIKA
jgi:DNA-binding response OmpR family regulator